MQIRFIIWSKSNELNSTFRSEFIFNLVLKFQNMQVWLKWMSSFKSASKALVLIMSIIPDMLFMPEWIQLFLILYVFLDQEPLLWNHKTRWIKLKNFPKLLSKKWVFSLKEYLFLDDVLSSTLQINYLESFKKKIWSIERNYPSLMRLVLPILYPIVLRKSNTCKSIWNSEKI